MRKIFIAFIAFFFISCNSKQSVDLIVHNATIYTVDSSFSTTEAMAIKDGKIIATGTNEFIQKNYSAKENIDAQGKTVYPGFIDAHAHFVGYGNELFTADLYDSKSFDEVVERLKAFAAAHPDEKWILGRGWDQNKWPGKSYPTNEKLNQLFPDKPVYITRVDGHAAICNQKAFDIANVKANQKINGGDVETINGKLTGILIDNAKELVSNFIPQLSKEDYAKRLMAAEKNCFAVGLTTITDCGLNYKDVDAIDTLQKAGKLNMRLYIMLSDDKENFDRYLPKGPYKTDKLFVHGFKFYADGALGSRGACLLQPYNDKKDWKGFLLNTKSHYDSMAAILANTEFQMCTHAIGDSGNRVILNTYNKVLKGKNDKRWRIEHAQIINENDFNLFGQSSIIPSVQPTHATSDMYWAEERLGKERLKGGYAYKQLLQQNGWIPLGTDFPVEDISPFKTFLAAVVRKDAKGFPVDGFQKENALTREETIKGMTIWAAKADFLEHEVGSLEKGKKADFIILDSDLMKVAEDKILDTKVLATYLDGKKVFGK
ncbi:N-substituted formamide deformylase precursor [mine drainage metagenome]|uniref:N-substituted formamide deformylase n=1 Tax=mine drainage metagenome TaxID=410659 RepID=A0A1J5SF47_9ZZZZ